MNTIRDTQRTLSVDLNRWFFATVFSVAISCFLTITVGILSHWSNPIIGVALWLTTSICCSGAQGLVIGSAFHVQPSRWLPGLLVSSSIGWTISLFLVYPLIQVTDVFIDSSKLGLAGLVGVLVGGIIGLFPGIFIGIAYWWLIGSDENAERLILSNVIGWCLGTGLVFASIFVLLSVFTSRMFPIF